MITTFGAWDIELKSFITGVASQSELGALTLQKWFYEKGMGVFEGSQSQYYKDHWTDIPFPELTSEYMRQQKQVGFEALKVAFLNNFANDDNRDELTVQVQQFIDKAQSPAFRPFMAFQAELTTVLNIHMAKNGPLSRVELLKMVKQLSEETIQQIEAHQVLMDDYIEMNSLSPSPSQFFKPVPQSAPTPTANTPAESLTNG